MKIRCELHLAKPAKLILVAKPEETLEHLALKLAAFAMFLDEEPVVDLSADHPALNGTDYRPDVCAFNVGGEIDLWIECGSVTLNKLNKVTRQFPNARLIVIKERPHEAERLRREVNDEVRQADRIEIWAWPEGQFAEFKAALADKTELFGEAHERSFNLVINHTPYAVDLLAV